MLKQELTEENKKLFGDFIRQKSGLKIEESPALFSFSLLERIKATNKQDANEYVNFLMFHPDGKKELAEFLELLTIKETYFFRNPPHFKVLREKIIPEIVNSVKNKMWKNIRLWSAGCSTGEEPYTIAILMKEYFSHLQNWNIEILATDLSAQAIHTAIQGVYSDRSVKFVDKEILKKYFYHRHDKYYISDEIKKMVNFQIHNLVVDKFPENFDVIFCRNVTIYFPKEITKQIMLNFHTSLKPGGYLIIGHSESLYGLGLPYQVIDMEDAFVYKKIEKTKEIFTIPEHKPYKTISLDLKRTDISTLETTQPSQDELYARAEECFKNKKYKDAISYIEQIINLNPRHAKAWALQGKIYANQGNYEKAIECLQKAISIDQLLYDTHFLLGVISSKTNLPQAVEHFKKSVYSNPNFPLSHFYLANIYKDIGKIKDSIREYRNCLSLLNSKDDEVISEFTEGLSAEFLKEMCENNIKNLTKLVK